MNRRSSTKKRKVKTRVIGRVTASRRQASPPASAAKKIPVTMRNFKCVCGRKTRGPSHFTHVRFCKVAQAAIAAKTPQVAVNGNGNGHHYVAPGDYTSLVNRIAGRILARDVFRKLTGANDAPPDEFVDRVVTELPPSAPSPATAQ